MLRNDKIFLRAVEPSDIESLYAWENDTTVWHVSNTLIPFSKHHLETYVNSVHDIFVQKQFRFIICESATNTPVGCLDFYDYDPLHARVGIGILVDAAYRKQGFATLAIELGLTYVFATWRVHQVFCTIPEDNEESIRLFRQAGFVLCGTRKDWLNTPNGYISEHLFQYINNG